MISDGACRSEVGRLAYNHITNNMVDIVASSGPASACADFCSLYDRRPGYVGFSVRITGTSNLEDYPIGRCQCQFEGGTEQPDLSDAPASTTSWWGSTASLPIDVLQGNGNSDYVCYPWIPMAFFWQATQGVKVVFVTSKRYNGGLGGLAGANDKCQARADAHRDYLRLAWLTWGEHVDGIRSLSYWLTWDEHVDSIRSLSYWLTWDEHVDSIWSLGQAL